MTAVAEGPAVSRRHDRRTIADRAVRRKRFRRAPSDELDRPRPTSKSGDAGTRHHAGRSGSRRRAPTRPVAHPTTANPSDRTRPARTRSPATRRTTVDGRRHSGRGDANGQRARADGHDGRRATVGAGAPATTAHAAPGRRTRADPPTANGLSNSWKPSMLVVAVLLVVAALVGGLLWFNLQYGGGDVSRHHDRAPDGRHGRADRSGSPVRSSHRQPTPLRPGGRPGSAADRAGHHHRRHGVRSRRRQRGERRRTSLALADGDATTSWATSCYESQYMGGQARRRARGLVRPTDPAGPDRRRDQRAVPAPVLRARRRRSHRPTSPFGVPPLGTKAVRRSTRDRHIATPRRSPSGTCSILLNELGRDDSCTDAHPYQGRLGEIALVG